MFDWSDESAGREGWRPDGVTELAFGDPDAWRGGTSADPEAWRRPTSAPEPQPRPALDPARPDVLEHGWPAADAGPEYLMWKKRTEGD